MKPSSVVTLTENASGVAGILILCNVIIYSIFYLGLVEHYLLGLFYDQKLANEYRKTRNQKSSSSYLTNHIKEIDPCPFDRFNNNASIAMDNPDLVDAVKKLIFPPSLLPYKLYKMKYLTPDFNPSAGQTQAVAHILRRLGGNGFYVECGAYNGEFSSNTLWIERTLGWKGLLIEPNPPDFAHLQAKHRNAWSGNFCISNLTYPSKMPLYESYPSMGGIIKIKKRYYKPNSLAVMVQCIPLYTVLLAINRTKVDFFSLDVEGSELNILRTIPFNKVMFKVITVDHIGIEEGREGLKKFMESKGYILYKTITDLNKYGRTNDSIFLHKSVTSKLKPEEKKRMKERARQPETGRPRDLMKILPKENLTMRRFKKTLRTLFEFQSLSHFTKNEVFETEMHGLRTSADRIGILQIAQQKVQSAQSLHFETSQFIQGSKIQRLKSDALPTISPASPAYLQREIQKRESKRKSPTRRKIRT